MGFGKIPDFSGFFILMASLSQSLKFNIQVQSWSLTMAPPERSLSPKKPSFKLNAIASRLVSN